MRNRSGLFGLEERIDALAPKTGSVSATQATLLWFSAASALPIVMLAFLLAGTVDLILARNRAVDSNLTIEILLQVLGLALLWGAVCAGVVAGLAAICCRPGARGRLAGLILGALLAGGWLLEAPALFSGPGFLRLANADLIRLVALVGGTLAALGAGFFLMRRLGRPRPERSPWRESIASLFFLGLGLGLMVADARLVVGGYPGAHRLALIAAILAFSLGLTELGVLLEDRMPRSGRMLGVLTLVLGLIGLALLVRGRQIDSVHALRGRLLGVEHPFARKLLAPTETLLLDHIVAIPRPPERDAARLLARAFVEPMPASDLDLRLGQERRRFNIVIIAADTLRHDVVGWSDQRRPDLDLTPHLDRFAARSLVFSRAYAPYPTSSYTYSSVLTGLYPRWSPARAAVRERRPTDVEAALPLVLQGQGYATWAATAFNAAGIGERGPFGHVRTGFDVVNPLANSRELGAPEVTATALELLEERDPNRPFLLWAHYMDPHASYRRHEEFDLGQGPRDLYHGEVAFMDRHMAPLLQRLEQPDLAESTIVVFLSDHGESFGEHDTSYHNSNLHDEQIRVPVVLRIPGLESDRRDRLFNLVDLTPTLLGLTGHRDDRPRHGRDLSAEIVGHRAEAALDFSYSERFPRDPLPGRDQERALVFGSKKLIRFAGDPSARVYDLANDPAETKDVFDPRNEEHQLLLGFMSALDQRIDGLFSAEPVDRKALQIATAEAALSDLADDDRAADFMPLVGLAKLLFDGEKRYRSQTATALGPERLSRIRECLEVIAADESRPDLHRKTAFTFLVSLPLDELEPFMSRCLTAPSEEARLGAALWLARRGRDDGREALLSALKHSSGDWCMAAAPALAALGELSAAPWLLPGIERVLSSAAAESVASLGRLGHHDLDLILRELLGAQLPGLDSRAGLSACAEAMNEVYGLDADQVLARLANSPVPEARRAASRALAARYPENRRRALEAMAGHQIIGDQLLAEQDPQRALAAYEEAIRSGAEIDVQDAFLELRTARCRALGGRPEAAISTLRNLLGSDELRIRLRREAQALLEVLEEAAPLERATRHLGWTATLLEPGHPWPLRQGEFFARRVRLGNPGQSRVLGGAWPRGLRLAWYFKNESGEFVRPGGDSRLPSRFLRPEGLGAGDSLELVTIGRLPPRPGRYVPVLVLVREPWFSTGARPLLELPPVEVW